MGCCCIFLRRNNQQQITCLLSLYICCLHLPLCLFVCLFTSYVFNYDVWPETFFFCHIMNKSVYVWFLPLQLQQVANSSSFTRCNATQIDCTSIVCLALFIARKLHIKSSMVIMVKVTFIFNSRKTESKEKVIFLKGNKWYWLIYLGIRNCKFMVWSFLKLPWMSQVF